MKEREPDDRPSRARRLAFDILGRVESAGAWADVLLERRERDLEGTPDAGLLHELVLGVLRHRARLDHVLALAASRPVEKMDRPVRTALRIGAYNILFLDRVPDFAAVATAVELARRGGAPWTSGFVNAVLRRVARDRESLLPEPPSRGDVPGLALFHSHPVWWATRLVERRGWDATAAILEADNRPATTVLRPNARRATAAGLAARLLEEGIVTEPGRFAPEALRVVSGIAQRTAAFREACLWMQDEASQLVPLLFGRTLGRRVVDLCAAPGMKTLALAEALPGGGLVVASDRHEGRLRRLAENVARHGLAENVRPVVADAAGGAPFRGGFDQVLVDAPCSGTGTLRRHPEIRWRLSPEDLPALADRQRRILDTAAALVAPGGEVVYSVCSLEPEEGTEVVRAFLDRHPAFEAGDVSDRLPAAAQRLLHADGSLATSPADDLDGFQAFLLVRRRGARGEPGVAPAGTRRISTPWKDTLEVRR